MLDLQTKKISVYNNVLFYEEYFPFSSDLCSTLFPSTTTIAFDDPLESYFSTLNSNSHCSSDFDNVPISSSPSKSLSPSNIT